MSKEIGSPIIQYDETDWQFHMRICSHFHESLIPNLRIDKPAFYFGMPEGNNLNIN